MANTNTTPASLPTSIKSPLSDTDTKLSSPGSGEEFSDVSEPTSPEIVGQEKEKGEVEVADGGREKEDVAEPRMDGGFDAWAQVAGCFCLYINTWGIINSYGVFQTYYANHLLNTHSQSDIAWIGSFQGSSLLIVGFISGPLYDAGYMRSMIVVGSILSIAGMLLTSWCHNYWEVFLAQGVAIGLGSGLVFLPSMSILPQFFVKKKALAQGIASLGSSIGAMIYPIIFHQLLIHVGFGWATRTMAFCMLLFAAIPVIFMHQRIQAQSIRSLYEKSLFTDIPYLTYTTAFFFGFMGIYVPFFFIEQYAESRAGVSPGLAAYLLVIVNGGSVFGRLVPNYIADKIGPLQTHVPLAFCAAILVFASIAIADAAGIIVFCALYGFFSGTYVSLGGPICATLAPNLNAFGTRMGLSIGIAGIGLLVGNPIAGAIYDIKHQWAGLQAWAGALMFLSASLLGAVLVSRVLRSRRRSSGGEAG